MAVDLNGNVTVDTLGKYIYDTMSLPSDKRLNQKPVRKVEAGGTIILAYYQQFDKTRVAAKANVNWAELESEQSNFAAEGEKLSPIFLVHIVVVHAYVQNSGISQICA